MNTVLTNELNIVSVIEGYYSGGSISSDIKASDITENIATALYNNSMTTQDGELLNTRIRVQGSDGNYAKSSKSGKNSVEIPLVKTDENGNPVGILNIITIKASNSDKTEYSQAADGRPAASSSLKWTLTTDTGVEIKNGVKGTHIFNLFGTDGLADATSITLYAEGTAYVYMNGDTYDWSSATASFSCSYICQYIAIDIDSDGE